MSLADDLKRETYKPRRRTFLDELEPETLAELEAVREAWQAGEYDLPLSHVARRCVEVLNVKVGTQGMCDYLRGGR